MRIIGNYNFIRKLGYGNFASVWYAEHIKTHEKRAIKILSEDAYNRQLWPIEDIKKEYTTLANLSMFPNCNEYIICLYDLFSTNTKSGSKNYYIVTEYIEGMTLEHYIDQGKCHDVKTLISIFYKLIMGLKYIYSKGYHHGDLFGKNIMVSNDGYIKYIDFGNAGPMDTRENYELINLGMLFSDLIGNVEKYQSVPNDLKVMTSQLINGPRDFQSACDLIENYISEI